MAGNSSIYERIKSMALEYEKDIIALRRHFHANPETAWDEVKTTDRIAEELEKLGCVIIRRGFNNTKSGLIAEISGGKPGKCIALRADIDALKFNEENDVEYRSKNANAMHACGHDAHTACLIGAAKVLTKIKGELKGKVRLFFQPSEEDATTSGAKTMVSEGALDGVDAIFGIHVFSTMKSGLLQYRSGPMMAASDVWRLTIHGKGGHGSSPHETFDPTIAAVQILGAYQTIISREVSPREPAVLSTGAIETSSKVINIIPERVEMSGSVRTFNPEVQDQIEAAMKRIAKSVGEACRCRTDFTFQRFLPVTINDHKMTELLKEVGTELFGADVVQETPLIMGSEDFSYYCQKVPGTFLGLGVGSPDDPGTRHPHHSPKFNIDESQLYKAAAIHASMAWRYLEEN